jgi:hypothetical protein
VCLFVFAHRFRARQGLFRKAGEPQTPSRTRCRKKRLDKFRSALK